jgi:hypothetical protein
MKIHPAACIAHNAAQPQPKTRRQIRRRAWFVATRCHHKAKVKLGPSLHRSQIFREFVSDAGSGSGILRLCRTIPLLFGEKNLNTVCFN